MMKKITLFVCITLSFLVSNGLLISKAHAYDLAKYKYILVFNNNENLCKHMQGVFNRNFKQPWNMKDYIGWDSSMGPLTEKIKYRIKTRYSFYPNSQEFDAIKWDKREYKYISGGRVLSLPVLTAIFDIDNDSNKNIVIKAAIFNGSPNSYEDINVYNYNDFDLKKELTLKRISQNNDRGIPPRIIGGAKIIRPFIYNSTSYLMFYNAKEPRYKDEYIEIVKYLEGGVVWPGKKTKLEIQHICKFKMERIQ